jgi:hypothetical protein
MGLSFISCLVRSDKESDARRNRAQQMSIGMKTSEIASIIAELWILFEAAPCANGEDWHLRF